MAFFGYALGFLELPGYKQNSKDELITAKMDIRIEHRNVFCKAVTVQRVKGDYIAIGEKATFSNGVIGPDKNQTVLGG